MPTDIQQSFDVAYPDHPWANLSTNQRHYYDPNLREIYWRQAVYSRFVTLQFPEISNFRAQSMSITSLIPPHANSDPIGVRQLWMPSSYMDSFERQIRFQRYGGKLALHEFDRLITYWQLDNQQGLLHIIDKYLGRMMVNTLDKLARNAFVNGAFSQGGYAMVGKEGAKSNWGQLDSSDVITTDMIDAVHLGMGERDVPYAAGAAGPTGSILCITSPGVLYTLQREAGDSVAANKWVNANLYANAMRLVQGEVGMYHHIRFIQTPKAILYNAGQIIARATVVEPIVAGTGAPDPNDANSMVDGARRVGQPDATHYIQLAPDTDMSDFALNDIVSIHRDVTDANGVDAGVDYTDGTLHNLRIVGIDAANKRLSFEYPIMEDFTIDLGGGRFAYVTKAHHVHTALFLGGADGIAMGVGMPPRVKYAPPIDDYLSMHRFVWDARIGYQLFEPQVFEVAFLSAPNRYKGAMYTGVAPTP